MQPPDNSSSAVPGHLDPLARATALFADEGLPFPPLPASFSAGLIPIGDHCMASRELALPLYHLNAHFAQARQGAAPDYAALGFDGHGINSWAAHFYLVTGSAAIFLQCRWGNAFDDAARARERIEGAFGLASQLIDDLAHAQRAGRLVPGHRLLLRFTDFSESGWGWADQPDNWHDDGDFTFLSAIGALRDLPKAR